MKPIFYILLSLLLVSCGDDDNQKSIDHLPPLTNTGAQTFGCLIDGRAFTPILFLNCSILIEKGQCISTFLIFITLP